jgi:biopolymer transport protein ExbB/TolQ
MTIEQILFEVSNALRVPVLVLALVALAVTIVELGALAVEMYRRRGRGIQRLEAVVDSARVELRQGDPANAARTVRDVGYSRSMEEVLSSVIEQRDTPDASDRIAKRMAEYDYRSLRRLERTRILVRAGPALGLMGTLIPLSPALAGLASGDVAQLTENLQVAFSVTVAGLLIGAVAFAISLVRDRLYAQDYSDVEFVAAALAPGNVSTTAGAAPHPATPTPSTPPPSSGWNS